MKHMESAGGKTGDFLRDRLRVARARLFVGRAAERAAFASALQTGSPVGVIWVCGPGGIGKSALLDRFADEAEAQGRPVYRVDGRDVLSSADAFAAVAGGAAGTPGAVVLVDTFEQCGELEGWLRRDFAPGLPASAVLVVASRRPPELDWRSDPAWAQVLQIISLRDLPAPDANALLEARNVPAALRSSLLAFAGGHPLALSLAAQVAESDELTAAGWAPRTDTLRALISRLVGTVPTPAHQHALQVCAHAYDTTQELLRAVLGPGHDAHALFNWLCDQPFVEFGADGVFPHDVVRDALDLDLRWRDPEGYEAMHRGIRRHLLERVQDAPAPLVLPALQALSFLHRRGGVMPDFVTWQRRQDIQETGLTAADTAALLAMTTATEGEDSARIAAFWLSRQPSAFRVYRGPDGRPVGFMAWLRLTEPADDETRMDPVAAAVWEHCRAAAPIRPGEHLAVARFMINTVAYQRPCVVTDLVQMRILSEWLRASRLAWSYIAVAEPQFWQPQMDYLDQHLLPARPSVGSRECGLYAHDWRQVPVEAWLDRHLQQELFGPRPGSTAAAADLAVLSRAEFDSAVRAALRSWRRPDQFAANPLLRTRLAVKPGEEPRSVLRESIAAAAADLAQDPRTQSLHRAIDTTFFRGVPTQEAAAERLGLPLSTYRRHLARGLAELCDLLWSRELYGQAGLSRAQAGAATFARERIVSSF
jgi:hypothetical protein